MNHSKLYLFLILFASVFLLTCKKNDYKNIDCSKIDSSYTTYIKPIINSNCLSAGCHNTNSSNGDLTTYAGLKAKVSNGSLESRVLNSQDMPPSKALSLTDRKKIKCWLNNGAPNN